MIDSFKQADIDPREIILMFKELYESSPKLQTKENLVRPPTHFIPKIVESALQNSNQGGANNQMNKIREAKKYFMSLLDVLNAKFAGEVKKEAEKQVTFMYSKFSPLEACIPKTKVYLKEMLGIV